MKDKLETLLAKVFLKVIKPLLSFAISTLLLNMVIFVNEFNVSICADIAMENLTFVFPASVTVAVASETYVVTPIFGGTLIIDDEA